MLRSLTHRFIDKPKSEMQGSIHKCGIRGSQILKYSPGSGEGHHCETTTDISGILPLVYTNNLHFFTNGVHYCEVSEEQKNVSYVSIFLFVQLSDNILMHTFCTNIQTSQLQFGVALPLTCSHLPSNQVLLCHHETILLPSEHFHGLKNFSHLHSSHLHLLCI
jgi:hypothetical protein